MDLVVDQVVELQHVHDAHGDVLVERLAGAAVEQDRPGRVLGRPASSRARLISLLGAPSNTGDAMNTPVPELPGEARDLLVVQARRPAAGRLSSPS